MKQRVSAAAIYARLGVEPHDADFELVGCDRCGHQSLVDHENLRVYLDPMDLRVFILNVEGETWPPCRGCGSPDWDFVAADRATPEWEWAVG